MIKIKKNILLALCIVLCCSIGKAKEYEVKSALELSALTLLGGDKVILKSGVWKDQKLVFKGNGNVKSPITLIAQKSGEVILSGNSSLMIDGNYLVVDGLVFKDGYTLKENVISFSANSSNCRLTNTSITTYDNPDKKVRNSWVVFYGERNRMDHCYIKGKTSIGTTIGVYVSDKPNYHRIDHNYFAGRPPFGGNGGEIIRMGTDQWSMHDSYTIVEENIFEHCDGEIEIVSNKSTNNTIRNNLFYESKGMLTLRHGNFANVHGNLFIGNGIPETGGVRVIGENHKIYNNYFYRLTGTGLNAALTFMNAWENPPLWGYWQVKNAQVFGNTFIDCTESIVVGSGKNEKTFIPLTNSIIANNVIKSVNPLIVWTEPKGDNKENLRFANNLVEGEFTSVQKKEGFTNQKIITSKNRYGIEFASNKATLYKNQDMPYEGLGFSKLNKEHQDLLNGNGIGPTWMKINKQFLLKR